MSHRKTIIRMTPFGNRLSYNNLQALPNNIKQIETNLTALFTNSDGISLDKLHPIISEIDKVIKTYETGLCDKDDDSFHEINFIMKMDKALLLTKKGQFLSETNHPIEASDCLREATEIYLSLDRDPRFFREAMLKYRLSSLLLVANEVGSALEKLKQAVALLPNDRRIPKTHILQISIRRQCSYVYWRSKQVIWSEGESVGDVRLRREDQIDLMINAVSLIRKCIEILCNIPESKEKEIESLRVWNNFICFSWEIIDLGHALSMSQEDKVNIGKAIKSINEAIPDYTRQLTALDTLTKAAQSVGDQELQSDYWVAMKKEFRRQSDPKKRTDGYTQSELKYIEYCIEKLKINR